MINKSSKIFIAGRYGMVGSAIEGAFVDRGYMNIVGPRFEELDLRNQRDVEDYFANERPDAVVLAAAKVGGILANIESPAEFLFDNLAIQNNVINYSYKYGVKRLLFLGSSCIYPRLAPQPMEEDYLLSGKLEPTNEGYAIAKIAGIKMCEMYNRQYNTNYFSVIPCNLYGPRDNFHPDNSHVIPGMIRKFHEAKIKGESTVQVWGTGKARREFMYSKDMANACIYLFENYSEDDFLNIGTGVDVSIKELAEIIRSAVGYEGKIVFDSSKPDGMPQKLLSVKKISEQGWTSETDLFTGIEKTYKWFLENIDGKTE